MLSLASVASGLRTLQPDLRYGRVVAVRGALIEVEEAGRRRPDRLAPADRLAHRRRRCRGDRARPPHRPLPAVQPVDHAGHRLGRACASWPPGSSRIRPSNAWLGRVVDGLGRPVDGKGQLLFGADPRPIKAHAAARPRPARPRRRQGRDGRARARHLRPALHRSALACSPGSGTGKSALLSMLARWTECDVAVIGLVGERGREVRGEFVEDDLGPEGLARSVVVVATSDEPALMRRQAAWTTLAIAEHFRDQGLHVLCLMDSVTRFAMAQREIGLASGEPPATKGYTPAVFAELPRLAGAAPGRPAGAGARSPACSPCWSMATIR